MARFIEEGLLGRHIRKASRIYAARHELISNILRRDFADLLELVPSAAGLHLCTLLRPGVRFAELPGVEPLDRYCFQTVQSGLVLGYGAIDMEQIPAGLARLRKALKR